MTRRPPGSARDVGVVRARSGSLCRACGNDHASTGNPEPNARTSKASFSQERRPLRFKLS
jgi:hypothetical protein